MDCKIIKYGVLTYNKNPRRKRRGVLRFLLKSFFIRPQFIDMSYHLPLFHMLKLYLFNRRNGRGIKSQGNKGVENILVNVGDYIQSIAAMSFYDTIDMFLERETLHDYNNGNFKIKVILNGWFMHNPENWPPSDAIIPKIISFHISPSAAPVMLGTGGIAYLKKHGPVGCRDHWTKTLLDKHGIPCCFSGCLTLTLGRKYKEEKRDGKIYFVDMPLKRPGIGKLVSYIPIITRSWKKIIEIQKKQKRSILHAALFYCIYQKVFADDILTSGEFIAHYLAADDIPDDKKRFEYAEGLIKKYAKAGLVITSRLHCALPCLGLETPVIFIPLNIRDERFSGIKELLRVMNISGEEIETEDEMLRNIGGKITMRTKIENKRGYIKIKEALENECKEFMKVETGTV
jgi:hypothetical protein